MTIHRTACLAAVLSGLVASIGAAGCSSSPPRDEVRRPPQSAATPEATPTAAPFGRVGDTPVQLYTLTNRNGLVAKITELRERLGISSIMVGDLDTLAPVVERLAGT